ncbi:hypothetical protein B6U67_04815 [Methanosarcinales archaeon ex4484_138]|nr:MAG: hypothetical protein B6U67_04815 [Methanosarcinales archaeon ex4484_138]
MISKITMAIFAALLVGMIAIPMAVYADDGGNTTIKVIPSSIDCNRGEEFSIEIVVDPDGAEVYGVQYELIFDTTSIECVNQTAGDFLSQDGENSFEIVNRFNNTIGKVEYGNTRIGVKTGVTSAGTLANITFRATGDQGSHLELTDVIVSSPQAEEMPVSVESGVCLVDGKPPRVTAADAAIALEMAVRGEYSVKLDVNGDSKITSLDALMILQSAAGT